MALFRLLETLREELGITLCVVHFNHSLRGEESERDADFVRELARSSGFEFLVSKEDVAAEAARNGWNLEDAARRLRYAYFNRLADGNRVTRIAVAHTADDQAETVLAHMIRGTGLAGLGGIHPAVGPIVRPLLDFRRTELRQYLKSTGQTWREDLTNQDLRRTRARIRSQILPQLEVEFSPQIVPRLVELARLAREEGVFWKEFVERRYCECVRQNEKSVEIGVGDLLGGPGEKKAASAENSQPRTRLSRFWRPLTERLIRRLYEEVRGDCRGLSAQNVRDVIRLAEESSSGHAQMLPGGIVVERDFDTLRFFAGNLKKDGAQKRGTTTERSTYRYEVRLQVGGTTSVSVPELGSCFHLKVIDWSLAESETKRGCEVMDADLIGAPLILRNWQPGDAYRPHGRRESRKLKEFFRTVRARSRERELWPVLESGGRVIWARGLAPAEEICASEKTRAGVVIEEVGL